MTNYMIALGLRVLAYLRAINISYVKNNLFH